MTHASEAAQNLIEILNTLGEYVEENLTQEQCDALGALCAERFDARLERITVNNLLFGDMLKHINEEASILKERQGETEKRSE